MTKQSIAPRNGSDPITGLPALAAAGFVRSSDQYGALRDLPGTGTHIFVCTRDGMPTRLSLSTPNGACLHFRVTACELVGRPVEERAMRVVQSA